MPPVVSTLPRSDSAGRGIVQSGIVTTSGYPTAPVGASTRRQASAPSLYDSLQAPLVATSMPLGSSASIAAASSIPMSPLPQVMRSVSAIAGPMVPPQVLPGMTSAGPPVMRLSSVASMPSVSSFPGQVFTSSISTPVPGQASQLESMVYERDQRLMQQDRLVDDLRQAIDSQRREAEELRRQQTELLFTNQEQAQRLADLESLLQGMNDMPHALGDLDMNDSPRCRDSPRGSRGRDSPRDSPRGLPRGSGRGLPRRTGRGAMAKRQLGRIDDELGYMDEESHHDLALHQNHDHHLLGGDRIDLALQEFFDMYPDFDVGIRKHKPGWYTFDPPIKKKVYMKVVGENVIVRAGGGHVDLHAWLEGFRSRAHGGGSARRR